MGSTFDEKVAAIEWSGIKPKFKGDTKKDAARRVAGAMIRNEKRGKK